MMEMAARGGPTTDRSGDPLGNTSAPPFTVAVNVAELRHQMRIRGFSGSELARRAGISTATVSHALNGRRIHPGKLRAMAAALGRFEPLPGIDDLVDAGRRNGVVADGPSAGGGGQT